LDLRPGVLRGAEPEQVRAERGGVRVAIAAVVLGQESQPGAPLGGERAPHLPGKRPRVQAREALRRGRACGKERPPAASPQRRGRMRILHTMLRVGDLERSIAFYQDALGMQLISRKDYPGGKFTLAFLGYGRNPEHAELELTYNWGVEKYEMGTAYGHIALGV